MPPVDVLPTFAGFRFPPADKPHDPHALRWS